MTEPSLRRIEELFDQAIDLGPTQLVLFLDEQCQGDEGLRAAVEELLRIDCRAEATAAHLRSPLAGSRTQEGAPPAPGFPVIGRYRVVRVLGEGGMGTVYEAEQDNPRRTVALKVIRPGLASDALLKRFAREAQILGRLCHPGIGQVYDAGIADNGQPYFAMELIAGVPLDQFARQHALDVPGRLELLARVCDAVQHAHERGVIHRDLKPGNILVESSGQPKVLDFGVAHAADLRSTTAHTRTGQVVGTLNYMSPEQIAADPNLDRRSDVYTLGVILFELLAGRLPYPLEHLGLAEAARVIRDEGPARLGSLDTRCRGDVETIAAKALEKDRERRYPSAGELAADVRRHLRHEPIRARPPSALYQLAKFTRRHKALVVTTGAFLLLLLGGGAMTAWQAVKLARAERDQAVQQAVRSQDVQNALAQAAALREQARVTSNPGKWAEAREAARGAEALANGGPVESGLAERVAVLRRELNEEEKDRRMVARLEEVRLREAEVQQEQVASRAAGRHRETRYADAFRWYGVDVEALPVAEGARRVRGSKVHEALLAALDHWAWYKEEGPGRARLWAVADGADDNAWRRRLREAARLKDRARLKELAGGAEALVQPPAVQGVLGKALLVAGLPEEAVGFLRQAQQRHPGDFWLNHDLAHALFMDLRPARPAEALGYLRAALALRPGSYEAHMNLGNLLREQWDLSGAEASFRRAGELNPKSSLPHWHLGTVLHMQGDLPGAVACGRKALEIDPKDAKARNQLGVSLRVQGDLPGATACFRSATRLEPENASLHFNLGVALLEQGDLPGAAACFRRAAARNPEDAKLGLWIKRCDLFIQLNSHLPALLKGEARRGGATECLYLGYLCAYKGLYATSARYFNEAFDTDGRLVDSPQAGPRYQAACSAALAGCGQGAEEARLDEARRAALLRQALRWLRGELAGRARRLEAATPQERPRLVGELRHWQFDATLAGVRNADRLAALPADERAGWQKLWADVAALVARAHRRK
jgi:tetratricopeptide (TPR) repeat protein/predicted Ser/Thr protein kinase